MSLQTDSVNQTLLQSSIEEANDETRDEVDLNPRSQTRTITLHQPAEGSAPNRISTTKYSLLSFLPLCLINQFTKLSNFYFLIVASLQSIPAISPLKAQTAVIPLGIVVGISMVREAVEDLVRHSADKQSNRKPVSTLSDSG